MKAGKLVTTLLLVLGCVLFFNACSFFDEGTSQTSTPTPKSLTVSEAEVKLRQAETNRDHLKDLAAAPKLDESEIQKLQDQAKALRKAANDARGLAKTARQQTINAGKNPDDPSSQKTYQAAENATIAEKKADAAEKKLEDAKNGGGASQEAVDKAQQQVNQASKDLDDARQRANKTGTSSTQTGAQSVATTQTGESNILLTTIFSFLATTVPLLVAICLLYRSNNKKRDWLEAVLRDKIREVKDKQIELQDKLDSILRNGTGWSTAISDLKKKSEKVEGHVGEVQSLLREQLGRSTPSGNRHLSDDAKIVFPIPAEEFLSRMKGSFLYFKHDYPNNMLIEDPNGAVALFRESGAQKGIAYVVPRLSRFDTKQDYHTHYQEYFDCNAPYSGNVVIASPAQVESVEGGWRLRDRGQLKVN